MVTCGWDIYTVQERSQDLIQGIPALDDTVGMKAEVPNWGALERFSGDPGTGGLGSLDLAPVFSLTKFHLRLTRTLCQ